MNCVAPGPVWTPLNAQARPASGMAVYAKESPMGRPAQPEELAPAYVYLASKADSGYVTGENPEGLRRGSGLTGNGMSPERKLRPCSLPRR